MPVMQMECLRNLRHPVGRELDRLGFTPHPGESARLRDRAAVFAGGVAFVGYGWYTGHQTSGVFVFSVWIFVIPFVAVGHVAWRLIKGPRVRTLNASAQPAAPELVWPRAQGPS